MNVNEVYYELDQLVVKGLDKNSTIDSRILILALVRSFLWLFARFLVILTMKNVIDTSDIVKLLRGD